MFCFLLQLSRVHILHTGKYLSEVVSHRVYELNQMLHDQTVAETEGICIMPYI